MHANANANIATVGSFARVRAALAGTPTTAPAIASAAVPMTPDRFAPSASGPTLDDLEGPAGAGLLPTTLEAAEPTGGGYHAPLHLGSRGAAVTDLQSKLEAKGFDPGAIDGVFGPATAAAVRAFQRSQGIRVDGIVGGTTRARLGGTLVPAAPSAPSAPAAPQGTPPSLSAGINNRYKGRKHQCFRYAWALVNIAGGEGIGSADQSRAGRWQGVSHLKNLAATGQLRPGDVVYVNRKPGADPSSTKLSYGPHWFVYLGHDRYADQYGIRGADAMANFVPGRKIDTIYRTFA